MVFFKNHRLIFLIAFASLFLTHGAKAQFLWSLSQPNEVNNRYQYQFSCLSCFGDDCTAAGRIRDYVTTKLNIVFWHSIDGGANWEMQDPNLPFETGDNQNQISVIQQIDSLNIVGIGDSGLVVRTFDGGKTWEKQNCNTLSLLNDVHFSDPENGIIVSNDSAENIITTNDGGNTWNSVSFGLSNAIQCHTFGFQSYAILKSGSGPVYSTSDNWKNVDSTKTIFDNTQNFNVFKWNILGRDTILAFGNAYGPHGLIIRSTNAGKNWDAPMIDTGFNYISFMTSCSRDTVFAAGVSINHILFSSDRGATWTNDSIFVNTTYPVDYCNGLAAAGQGHFLGTFNGIIIRGQSQHSGVLLEKNVSRFSIYPNPASNVLHINSSLPEKKFFVIDMLGRQVMTKRIEDISKSDLDISSLSNGIYSLLQDNDGSLILVGKFAVIARQ